MDERTRIAFMECDTQVKSMTVQNALELRRQTADLLKRLIADREQSERRLAEAGKRDPMKFITGRTAFDSAILSAQEMMANMNNLLANQNGHGDEPANSAVPHIHTLRFQPAATTRNGHGSGKTASNGVRSALSATMTT